MLWKIVFFNENVTSDDVNQLGYQLAAKNNKQHFFNETKEAAGKDRLQGCSQRNLHLSFRKPEQISAYDGS